MDVVLQDQMFWMKINLVSGYILFIMYCSVSANFQVDIYISKQFSLNIMRISYLVRITFLTKQISDAF